MPRLSAKLWLVDFQRRTSLLTVWCTTAVALLLAGSVAAQRLSVSFDGDVIGAPPDGFFFAANRQTASGTWQVTGTGTRRHLMHTADPSVTMRGISIAGFSYNTPEDVKVGTRLRLTEGDRAGGVIWGYRDANNFYFMALFHGDHSASIIRVANGNRVRLALVDDINLDADAWHTMSVVHNGDDIRGSIDGIGILRAHDRQLKDGNRAGVWSAGNTTSFFDDITIEQVGD
jgi:hypothetical protein